MLATLDSKDVADAKAVYLAAKDKLSLAETTFNREDVLFNKGVSSEQDRINARRALAQARSDMRSATQSLLTLGFRNADLERLEIEPIDLSRVDIMAPFAGEVIEKHIFTGEYLPQDREVFAVADLNVVWVHLLISLAKLKDTTVEAPVKITDGHGCAGIARKDSCQKESLQRKYRSKSRLSTKPTGPCVHRPSCSRCRNTRSRNCRLQLPEPPTQNRVVA